MKPATLFRMDGQEKEITRVKKNALLDIIEYYVRSHQSKPHGKLKENHLSRSSDNLFQWSGQSSYQ